MPSADENASTGKCQGGLRAIPAYRIVAMAKAGIASNRMVNASAASRNIGDMAKTSLVTGESFSPDLAKVRVPPHIGHYGHLKFDLLQQRPIR